MFDAPNNTLYNSLNNLFSRPQEYLADVCFTFDSNFEIWAHRAIILARAPTEFIQHYIPQLLYQDVSPLRIHINISEELLLPLIRFYYTASFYNNLVSPMTDISTPPISPVLSINSSINSSIPSSGVSMVKDVQHDLEQLGIQLGTPVLPIQSDTIPDSIQLVNDLKKMLDENIATDVTIHLVSSNQEQQTQDYFRTIPGLLSTHTTPFMEDDNADDDEISFRAHRFMLAARSSYFYALFCAQFQEASSNSVHLTYDLFNEAIIDVMLNYFYTDRITVTPLNYDVSKSSSPLQRKLQHNKHALRVCQKAFYAADYLGHMQTLGQALLCEMETLCHQFKCLCPECAVLLPSMLAWSDKHVDVVSKLRRALILLYSDPVHSLPQLWAQRPFALLITSMVPSTASLAEKTLQAVMKQEPLFRARTPKTFVHEIEERLFCNITKHNAINVLHSLHLCLSQIRSFDPNPSWSRPTLDLIKPILHYTVSMVSQYFDFYCVEYPILLSCVDGIGAGFSVDFLDFLLRHVLNDGIQMTNAGVIYQGIVRDLVGRQEVVKNMAIDDVLINARIRCASFISKHWSCVKSQGGFRTVEKSILRQLAEDINVPYRSLAKPFDSGEFSTIFSFKPKKSKKLPLLDDKLVGGSRRLSLGQLITRSSSSTGNGDRSRVQAASRPRALSTESVLVSGLRRYGDTITTPANAPLINLLSDQTLERQRILEGIVSLDPSTPVVTISATEYTRPVLRTSSSFNSLTDQLLPVDAIPSSTTRPRNKSYFDQEETTRPSRLKFELPTTPLRSPSNISAVASSASAQVAVSAYLSPQAAKSRYRRASNSKPRWGLDEDESSLPAVGDKVELLRRPLPTMGIIKYVGAVQFARGLYIGVELESRLGKSDGSVDGVRYFHTDPQRALFVKPDDFKILVTKPSS